MKRDFVVIILVLTSAFLLHERVQSIKDGGGVVVVTQVVPVVQPIQIIQPTQPVPPAVVPIIQTAPVNSAATMLAETNQAVRALMTQMAPTSVPPPTLQVYDTFTACHDGIVVYDQPRFNANGVGMLDVGTTWNIVGRNEDGSWVALGIDGVYAAWVPLQVCYTR